MKWSSFVLLFILAVIATTARAQQTVWVGCHGCTETAKRQLANTQVPNNAPMGDYEIYVSDYPLRTLTRYRIFLEREFGRTYRRLRPATPLPGNQATFDQLVSAYDTWHQQVAQKIEIPESVEVYSALDVLGNNANQIAVSDFLNVRPLISFIHSFGAPVAGFLGASPKEIIVFPDGSEAIFESTGYGDWDDGDWIRWRYEPGTAQDSEGNLIPDSQGAFIGFSGGYEISDNFAIFIQRVFIYGISVVFGHGIGGGPVGVTCVIEGGVQTCFVSQMH